MAQLAQMTGLRPTRSEILAAGHDRDDGPERDHADERDQQVPASCSPRPIERLR